MQIIDTVDGMYDLVWRLASEPLVAFDIETTGLDPYTSKLLLLSLATPGGSYVIDFTKVDISNLSLLRSLFSSPNIKKIAHNAVFDVKYIMHNLSLPDGLKFDFKNLHCTMIAEQVLKSGLLLSGFSLADLAKRRLGVDMDKSVRLGFTDTSRDFNITDAELKYSAYDSEILLSIYQQQLSELTAESQLKLFYDVEMPLVNVTARMELHGIDFNKEMASSALPVIDGIVAKADQVLQRIFISEGIAEFILVDSNGYRAINTASQKQMLSAFHSLGMKVESLNRKDLVEWDGEWALKNARGKNVRHDDYLIDTDSSEDFKIGYAHPVLRWHAIRTQAAKIGSTYITGLLNSINPVTGKVHAGYKQCGAVSTGRFSSNSPKHNWAYA